VYVCYGCCVLVNSSLLCAGSTCEVVSAQMREQHEMRSCVSEWLTPGPCRFFKEPLHCIAPRSQTLGCRE
jgi:hypothetical protein